FLVDLREQAGSREVFAYVEVPDACYDLATAGWEVIYPHVSYFGAYSLAAIFERAGWHVEATGTFFSGMFRFSEASVNRKARGDAADRDALPGLADRDAQLLSISGFDQRHSDERRRWQGIIADFVAADARPVLWGAGSRGVQFLNLADPGGA